MVDVDQLRQSLEEEQLRHNIPGMAVALVSRRHSSWAEGFELTDNGGPYAVSPDTRFSIQSISKVFTALGVLAAARDGLVRLDEPIVTYLPQFRVNSRFEAHPEELMTLRHLLSHTAGFTHEAPVGNNYVDDGASFEEHVASISSSWLRYPVGQRFSYSNLGFDLAGQLVATRSKQNLVDYLRRSVLEPLGLERTTFDYSVVQRDPDHAEGHDQQAPGRRFFMPMVAAGGCWSTASDLLRFLEAALGSFEGYLPPELAAELYRTPYPVEGQRGGYGLGVADLGGRPALYGHSGGGFGFLADLYWSPERAVGATVLTNCSWHPLQLTLARRLIDEANGPSEPVMPESAGEVQEAPELEPWIGQYIGRVRSFRLERTGDRLELVEGGRHSYARPTSPDELAVETPDRPRRFRRMTPVAGQPQWIVDLNGGESFDRSEAPETVLTQSESVASANYEIRLGTSVVARVSLEVADDGSPRLVVPGDPDTLLQLPLAPMSDGLFVAPTGEVFDPNSDPPTFRNIPLYPCSTA